MTVPTVFSVGSISLENGSTTVVCHDSIWAGNVIAGDYLFVPGQPLIPAVRLATDGDNIGATLAWPWPGTDVVEGAYEVQQTPDGARVLERMRQLLTTLEASTNVTGPGSSINNHVALFDGTSGTALKDGGALGTAAFVDTGTTSGKVPVLDGSGKLDTAVLPALAISEPFVVANQVAMLALTAQKGDVAIRSDLNKTFILATNSPSTLADWKEMLTPTDLVLAVAGLTGTISAAALKAALSIAAGDVSGVLAQGRTAMHIPASSITPRVTNGPGVSTYDSGTNDLTLVTLDFDASSQEFAHFDVIMPKSWDRGTVSAKFYWTNAAGATTQVVRWSLAAVAISDDDTLNATRGTAVTVDDTWLAQNDLHVSTETAAMTIAGSPAAEDLVVFEVTRVVSGVTGNMTGDAKLAGIALFINLNAATDA